MTPAPASPSRAGPTLRERRLRRRVLAWAVAVVLGAHAVAVPALASPPPPRAPNAPRRIAPVEARSGVQWNPRWPRFRTSEAVVTGVSAAAALGSLAIPPSKTRWNTVPAFDAGARSALRLSARSGRDFARDVSDVLLTSLINQLLVDAFVVAWWKHDRRVVAAQMILMDVEAFAFTGAVNALTAAIASRERPYSGACTGPEERQPDDCTSSKRYRSFFSGHASSAFTAASLTCAHHAHLPLYGGGAPDTVACAGALGAAAAVASMRVLADQHFVTDIVTGAAVGTLSGLGLPWLLHYRTSRDVEAGRRSRISVRVLPAPTGGSIIGQF